MPKQNPGKWVRFAKRFLNWKFYQAQEEEADLPMEPEEEGNPYLPQIREILEQILKKRKIPYEQFIPIIIDGSDSEISLMAAELLCRDLNRFMILTDQPAYFEDFADTMYEEQGLIVEVFPKDIQRILSLPSEEVCGNVILDFEAPGEKCLDIKFGKKIYIPIFKKRWERAGNLDITVPIGYNTMTVKISETIEKQPCLDKFEQAFYGNE